MSDAATTSCDSTRVARIRRHYRVLSFLWPVQALRRSAWSSPPESSSFSGRRHIRATVRNCALYAPLSKPERSFSETLPSTSPRSVKRYCQLRTRATNPRMIRARIKITSFVRTNPHNDQRVLQKVSHTTLVKERFSSPEPPGGPRQDGRNMGTVATDADRLGYPDRNGRRPRTATPTSFVRKTTIDTRWYLLTGLTQRACPSRRDTRMPGGR